MIREYCIIFFSAMKKLRVVPKVQYDKNLNNWDVAKSPVETWQICQESSHTVIEHMTNVKNFKMLRS